MSEANASILTPERKERLNRTLLTMFDYLGLKGDLQIEEKNEKIAVKITSDDAGRIIGRKGQILESLQLLINRMMFKGDESYPHVILNIDGYANGDRKNSRKHDDNEEETELRPRERRQRTERSRNNTEQLEQQARDAAKEVKRWGEPVKLPEMNAHDRRIIHVTLQNDPEISTESEGEGAMKKVVVSLKKEI